ncbi:unnamed protein product [Hymenolepis diminuta]|uniref:Succinate dehydrogenase assembly factor 2, mitochondrial n=1 Tax=Hymenolepis diminuta TaxID=6216 RepID=A0A0R3SB54_HYMDI|nr:unnamed protein product [Hymenolepis diminuta]
MLSILNRSAIALRASFSRIAATSRQFTNFTIPRRDDETIAVKRNRLLYESRKRGNLENGIILSSFADKYLGTMTMEQLDKYDHLINTIECDWDLFYWSTGEKEPPEEYKTDVLDMLQHHAKNYGRELRNRQSSAKYFTQ